MAPPALLGLGVVAWKEVLSAVDIAFFAGI